MAQAIRGGTAFPISRKQTANMAKMQALKPELDKLKEKYKGDQQAMGQAQMELYKKHGVNPLGSCWLMFLQMPIFLGLYYCLQESIHFRLAPFWPLWIDNLAAPDMLFGWGDSIPWISQPELLFFRVKVICAASRIATPFCLKVYSVAMTT